jgi:2-keto-4-pentenoate hydratase
MSELVMLMSTLADRYAHRLLDARAQARRFPPLSASALLSLPDAYDIAQRILAIRTAQGETAIGRKIGFLTPGMVPSYGVPKASSTLFWGHLFDATVRYVDQYHCVQSLAGALQPYIAPQIVIRLARTPAADASVEALADCLEWMAHGVEIVVCPFPGWQCEVVDAIAAFGLHGALLIGDPKILSAASRHNLATFWPDASVSLTCGDSLVGAGFGSDLMGGPLHALWRLHQLLQTQPQCAQLAAGDIIASGSWSAAYPVAPGQDWTTAFSNLGLHGLNISFA